MLKKRDIITTIILHILSSLCHFGALVVGFYLVKSSLNHHSHHALLDGLFLCLLMIALIIFNYLSDIKLSQIATNIKTSHLPDIFSKLTRLPIKKINTIPAFEFARLLINYEQAITMIIKMMANIGISGLGLLLIMGYLYHCSPHYALICSFSIISFTLLNFFIRRLHRKHLASQNGTAILATDFLNQILAQIDKIRTTNLEPLIYGHWLNLFNNAQSDSSKTEKVEIILWLTDYLLFPILVLSALIIDTPISLLFFSYQLAQHYQKISDELVKASPSLLAIQHIRQLVSRTMIQPPLINHSTNGDVKLINVHCRNLQDINLHIPAGCCIGITGASGAGKSTLLKLMLGLENEYSGNILFDGLNLHDLNADYLRQQFSAVLQTTTLFPGTIFSNIALNHPLTLAEAWQLAQQVSLSDEIEAMPMKMFTYVSDQAGFSLSSGQRQKILLARALARKPKVLFLDEATTFLDQASEAHLFNHLRTLPITKIIVAHRSSTLNHTTCVYNLDKLDMI